MGIDAKEDTFRFIVLFHKEKSKRLNDNISETLLLIAASLDSFQFVQEGNPLIKA